MITCTVLSSFRDFFRSHQRFAYAALFQATSKSISALASESTWFSGDTPGFFGVLHTWGRQLHYHPHIHYLVPARSLLISRPQLHSCPEAFYLPVKILSAKIKSSYVKSMQKAGLLHLLSSKAWEKAWNVHSNPVGNGARSLRYLSAYVFRSAISNHRILTQNDDRVVFRYTDTRTGKNKTMSLSPFEFIRRFLQHVSPTGFMKIRYYGFMHPSTSMPVKLAVALLEALFSVRPARSDALKPSGIPRCEHCGGVVRFARFISPTELARASGFT